jgi:hypothetical protein
MLKKLDQSTISNHVGQKCDANLAILQFDLSMPIVLQFVLFNPSNLFVLQIILLIESKVDYMLCLKFVVVLLYLYL